MLLALQDSLNPKDEGRHFILSYFVASDMISIFERPSRNSGIIGGKFLEKTRVPKPDSTVENPQFYSPADFAIGATVEGNIMFITTSKRSIYLHDLNTETFLASVIHTM